MARKFMDRLKRSKAFNLFLALMLTVSTLPVQAFAAESADVQSRMSGTCYVQCVRSEWDGGSLFNLTMPDGQVIQGYCLNPGWPTPVDGNYPFTAVDRGDGTYIVTVATSYITSDINQIHPFDHGHMVGRPPWRTQTVGNAIWAVLRYGKISLHKQSANPGCTGVNALYSLAGAEYGIYSDPGCTQWVATMVTDAAGNATSGDLKTGTYYVKEGKASEGFQVDPTVYTVNVAANATVAVNNGVVYETPINDPAGVIIAKYDGDKSYKGDSVVVFETLYRDGKEITAHADIDDEGQTVEFTEPSLGTTAEDGIDGDQSLVADGKAVIVDNVSYKGLVPGKEYKVVGTLMLKDTGELLLDANGKSVTAETTFTPDHDHGTVDVTFTFDASLLAGQQVVVFETLYRLDKEITVHADIEDENQTIEVIQPGVDTVAVDGFDGDKDVVADPEAEITDTLSYKNVIPGSTYEVHGILMDAETGLPLLSGEGVDKVGEDELTDFWHELCDLTGITSAKPLDEDFDLFAAIGGLFGQTDEDGDGDEVWFPQVEPDWEGIAALLEDNPEIAEHLSTATETFEADKDHGEIEMDFGLDASDLAGKKAVVFELLVKDGIAVGAHSDLADEDQTVTIVPSTIGTEATDKTDGDHEVMVSKEVTIVDAVHYENLLPGKEYTVKGVLMDKSTGKPLMVGDKKVEASASFTPNKPNGTVELEFTFDATGLEDKEVVAFETLYKDGIEVATHADIDDAAQTVKFVKPPKGGVYDKTGNMLSGYGWVAALLVVAAVAGAGYAGKQYLDARKEKDGDADGGES